MFGKSRQMQEIQHFGLCREISLGSDLIRLGFAGQPELSSD